MLTKNIHAILLVLLLVSISGCSDNGKDTALRIIKECEVESKIVIKATIGTFVDSVSISCEWIKKASQP